MWWALNACSLTPHPQILTGVDLLKLHKDLANVSVVACEACVGARNQTTRSGSGLHSARDVFARIDGFKYRRLSRNEEWFRGGLVSKAHRLMYH